MEEKTRKQIILEVVSDLVGKFLYYDRKADEDLPRGAIEEALTHGDITIGDIVGEFTQALIDGIPDESIVS